MKIVNTIASLVAVEKSREEIARTVQAGNAESVASLEGASRVEVNAVVADMARNPSLNIQKFVDGLRRGGAKLNGVACDDGTEIDAPIDPTSVVVEGRQIVAKIVLNIPAGKTWEKLKRAVGMIPNEPLGMSARGLAEQSGMSCGDESAVGEPSIIQGPPPTNG